jgi:hypothetical protein
MSKMTKNDPKKPHFWQIVLSTMAAAFGVQSRKNQERDFTGGSIYTYIVAGILFTFLFVMGVKALVSMVLSSNGL